MNERTLPQDVEAEQAVLGSLIVAGGGVMGVVTGLLGEADFYRAAHKAIYRAALALHHRGEPTDFALLCAEMERADTLDKAGGPAYLASLITRTPNAYHAEYYAGVVKDRATRRALIEAGGKIATIGYAAATAAEGLSEAQEAVLGLSLGARRDTQTAEQLASDFLGQLDAALNAPGQATGLPTGFRRLDFLTSGFRSGQLVILAGRPGTGKTSLAMHFAHLAAQDGTPVVVFSLEMGPDELFHRMACSLAGVDSRRLRTGYLDDAEVGAVSQAAGVLAALPLRVVDAAGMNVMDLAARARQEQAQFGCGLVVIDYLQLLEGPKSKDRTQEVGAISRRLTVLSRELRAPVLALSQLNRQSEQRTGKRPQLSDLRESGALEQDAHVVLLLHQDEEAGIPQGYLNILVAKNRSGPTGEVSVAFDQQYTRFRDIDDTHEDPRPQQHTAPWPGAVK